MGGSASKRHDKVFEYKTYDDEPHGFLRRENLQDVYERMEHFWIGTLSAEITEVQMKLHNSR